MSKPYSEHLFRLIQSMTKPEKRHFSIYARRFSTEKDKKFMCLYEAMEKYKLNRDEAILARYPQLSKNQLSNLKSHLYSQLLKSLQLINTGKHEEMQITEMIDHARILYNRCLYADSLSVIAKAKKKAIKHSSQLLLLELLELEKMGLRHRVNIKIDKWVETNISETENTVESIRKSNMFSNLAIQLNGFYQRNGFIRNKRDLKKVQDYFYSSLPEYKEEQLSFYEKLYLYTSFSGFYFFTQNFKAAYNYTLKWHQLFMDYPEKRYTNTELYIKSLNSLLVAQNKLLLYDEFVSTHKKLIALKRDKKISSTENINLNLFKSIYIHEINRHFMMGEFKSGIRIVSKLENEIAVFFPMLDTNTLLLFYYKIGCLYFGASNFKNALKWFNKIVYQEETEIREDLQAFARILALICNFELHDDDQVEYGIRNTYRYLLARKLFVNYQLLIMNFLRGLRKNYDEKTIIKQFNKLKNEMQELEKHPYEKRAFYYFDMISWLESKIENRNIQDVIKEKSLLRRQNK